MIKNYLNLISLRRILIRMVPLAIMLIWNYNSNAASVSVTATQGSISGTKFCACAGNITFTATLSCTASAGTTYTWSGDVSGSGSTATANFTSAANGKTATVTVGGSLSATDTLTFDVVGLGSTPSSVNVTYTFISYGTLPANWWGGTVPEQPAFDITAYCASDNKWKCKLTTATDNIKQSSRLLPGVTEVTSSLVNSTTNCNTLTTMKTSLNSVANQGYDSGYYMVTAVQAHETLHSDEGKRIINNRYATMKTSIEALTVTFPSQNSASDAKTTIKTLQGYSDAVRTFQTDWVTDWENSPISEHNPQTPFINAEHGVVDPMISTIDSRKTTLGCP